MSLYTCSILYWWLHSIKILRKYSDHNELHSLSVQALVYKHSSGALVYAKQTGQISAVVVSVSILVLPRDTVA